MSTNTEVEHEQRVHAAVDKALKKQARLAEADTLRRIAEASKAPAPEINVHHLHRGKHSSLCRTNHCFNTFPRNFFSPS